LSYKKTSLKFQSREGGLALGALCGSLRLCDENSQRKDAKDRKGRREKTGKKPDGSWIDRYISTIVPIPLEIDLA